MNILSLFDGMSCGQIALKELGVKVDNYFASEIDRHAISQTQHNFPNTIQLGSVTSIKAKDLPKIDIVIGGSPCQGFSFAGKQLNFNDPRSALFFEFVRIWKEVKEINPDAVFLLENVVMKKEYIRVISEYMGIFPVRINSNLVSAQNRDRLYWSNIKINYEGLFREAYTGIPQPKDRGILLKDIVLPDEEVDPKYFFDNEKLISFITDPERLNKKLTQINGDKAIPLLARQYSSWNGNYACAKFGRDESAKEIRKINRKRTGKDYSPFNSKEIVDVDENKMNTITTSPQKDNLIIGADYRTDEGLRIKGGEKSNTLTTKGGEAFVLKLSDYQGDKIHYLSAQGGNKLNGVGYYNGIKLRRLTIKECSRLQTIPEWYEWIVSDAQAYKMLGNGWTVDIIKHIFSFLKNNC